MIQSIAIIGAGISGLTTGCALREFGFKVDIFEKSESVTEFGAGITLSRNATSLLKHLNIYSELEKSSYTPTGSYIRHYKTAKDIAYMKFTKDFVTIDRRDFVKLLAARFVDLGGNLHLSRPVERIEADNGELFGFEGTKYIADLILACDGIRSSTRKELFDNSEPKFTKYVAWRGVVDRADFPEFHGNEEVNIYHGPGGHVVHYPMGHKDKINFVAIESKDIWEEESWKREGDKRDLLKSFEEWNVNISQVFLAADKVYKWGIFDRRVPDTLSKGKVFLLGDAAHPMVPFLGQGGCMAIEDAFTLAYLVNNFKDDPSIISKPYDFLRLSRASHIQKRSNFQGKFNHISNSLLMKIRNLAVKIFIRPNLETIHSYDALKAVSEALKK